MPQEAGNIHCVSIKEKKKKEKHAKKNLYQYALVRINTSQRRWGGLFIMSFKGL